MSLSIYVPPSDAIIHYTSVDFNLRTIERPVRLMQYDEDMAIVAVKLYKDGVEYSVHSDDANNTYDAHIKMLKTDNTFVIDDALGVDSSRHIVYFKMTYQMMLCSGDTPFTVQITASPTLQPNLVDVVHTGTVKIKIDKNPVQTSLLESMNEWKALLAYVDACQQAADEVTSLIAEYVASISNAKEEAIADINYAGDRQWSIIQAELRRIAAEGAADILASMADTIDEGSIYELYNEYALYNYNRQTITESTWITDNEFRNRTDLELEPYVLINGDEIPISQQDIIDFPDGFNINETITLGDAVFNRVVKIEFLSNGNFTVNVDYNGATQPTIPTGNNNSVVISSID